MPEYVCRILVRPVMENHLEHINIALGVLGLQEIMWLKLDPRLDLGRYLLTEGGLKLRKILDNELQVGKRLSNGGGVMTTRTTNLRDVSILEPAQLFSVTYIDDGSFTKLVPVISRLQQVIRLDDRGRCCYLHALGESRTTPTFRLAFDFAVDIIPERLRLVQFVNISQRKA